MEKLYQYLILIALAFSCSTAFAQTSSVNGTISGKISANDGKPAPFVSIQIVENNKKTISDEDGSFTFNNLEDGEYTLKTSYVGLQVQTQKVSIISGKAPIVQFTLSENSAQLDEVVISTYRSANLKPVSSGKIAINPLDLPQSVAIITSEVIRDQQANRLSDVLKNVNGIALGTTRGTTGENFFARGYSLGANNYIKNGSRSNSGSLPEASTLESIEVLKGSAALLYGNVSGGAIINMITKKPKFENGGEITFRTGSYDLYKPTADIYGPITKDIAFRVIGTYETAGNFRSTVNSNRYYVNPSLLYNISGKTSLLIQGDYLDYKMDPDFGIGSLAGKIPTNISRSSYFNTPWAFNEGKQATASAELNHQFNSTWKLNFIGSYQSFNRDYFSTERIQALENGDWDRKINRSKTAEDYYTAQVNLNGNFNTGTIGHTLLLGIDGDRYMNQTNAFDLSTSDIYDRINLLDPTKFTARIDMPATHITGNTKTPTDRIGFYIQDLVSLTEKFKVLAGIRYSYQGVGVPEIYTNATGDTKPSETIRAKYERAFSPRVGIVYQPIKTTSLFASYSNNFSPNNGVDIDGANLKASIIDQYEIGVKNDLLNGRITANVSVYKIINHDFAQAVLNPVVIGAKEFAGETTSDGLEIDLSGTIVQGLNFLAGYSYNFMRYTETPGTKGSNIEGERLVGNTAHTANGTLFYTFSEGKVRGLKLGTSVFYTGKRMAGWNNTVEQSQPGSRLIPVGGFTTIDLSAGYNFKKISLLAKVSNITNELNYYVHENYSVNPIPPTQFVTTIGYRF